MDCGLGNYGVRGKLTLVLLHLAVWAETGCPAERSARVAPVAPERNVGHRGGELGLGNAPTADARPQRLPSPPCTPLGKPGMPPESWLRFPGQSLPHTSRVKTLLGGAVLGDSSDGAGKVHQGP